MTRRKSYWKRDPTLWTARLLSRKDKRSLREVARNFGLCSTEDNLRRDELIDLMVNFSQS